MWFARFHVEDRPATRDEIESAFPNIHITNFFDGWLIEAAWLNEAFEGTPADECDLEFTRRADDVAVTMVIA